MTFMYHDHAGYEHYGTVDIRPDGEGTWSVYIDGEPVVARESYTVASIVADAFVRTVAMTPSEPDEVSAQILRLMMANAQVLRATTAQPAREEESWTQS